MGKYAKPQIECPECQRIMELINWQNEEHTIALVECPIHGHRQIVNVDRG